MNSLAGEISEVCDHLNKQAEAAYERAVHISPGAGGTGLKCDVLSELDPVIRRLVIRKAVSEMTPHLKDITREHIECIDSLLYKNTGHRADLPYGIKAYRDHDHIYIDGEGGRRGDILHTTDIDLNGLKDGPLAVSILNRRLIFSVEDVSGNREQAVYDTIDQISSAVILGNHSIKTFDYDKINKLLTLRYARPGDKLTIDAKGHSKPLNRYMADSKIPARDRMSIPVLADGSDIIWVIGYRDSYAFRIDNETTRILNVKLEGYDGRTS